MIDIPWFVAAWAFAPGAVVVVATVVKLREVRVARNWRETSGTVLTSKLDSRKQKSIDDKTRVENFPRVVFEYEVEGKRHRCDRISLGEKTGNESLESTLARYPVGARVAVFYDSDAPKRAVLVRDLPADWMKGLAILLAMLFGGPLLLLALFTTVPAQVAAFLPDPERAVPATLLAGMSLFTALIALAQWKQFRAMRDWSATPGKIVEAKVETYGTWMNDEWREMHRPSIVYEYQFGGRTYRGDRIRYGADISVSSPALLKRILTKYPVGSQATVLLDSRNAAEAVLQRSLFGPVALTIVAFGLAAGALAMGGCFSA